MCQGLLTSRKRDLYYKLCMGQLHSASRKERVKGAGGRR